MRWFFQNQNVFKAVIESKSLYKKSGKSGDDYHRREDYSDEESYRNDPNSNYHQKPRDERGDYQEGYSGNQYLPEEEYKELPEDHPDYWHQFHIRHRQAFELALYRK